MPSEPDQPSEHNAFPDKEAFEKLFDPDDLRDLNEASDEITHASLAGEFAPGTGLHDLLNATADYRLFATFHATQKRLVRSGRGSGEAVAWTAGRMLAWLAQAPEDDPRRDRSACLISEIALQYLSYHAEHPSDPDDGTPA